MSEAASDPKPARKASYAAATVTVLSVLVFVGFTLVGVAETVDRWPDRASMSQVEVVELCLWPIMGLAAGGLLLAAAALLRLLVDVHAELARLERFQYETRSGTVTAEAPMATSASDGGGPGGSAQWHELLLLLRDLRDNSLLSDEERREKKGRVAQDEIHNARIALRTLLSEGRFGQARELAENLHRMHPDEDEAASLLDEVERSRQRRESTDIGECAKQVADLINISAWDRARQLAEQLQQRHPEAIEARQLTARIERDYEVVQREQRQRMYAEIQRYTTRRRWEEARAAARTFMERFPHSEESKMLAAELPTLNANAEIGVRQEMESEIMDLATHGRYMEAVDLAKSVIAQFPESPQAAVLRAQLGRLEELANDPSAPPARVRID